MILPYSVVYCMVDVDVCGTLENFDVLLLIGSSTVSVCIPSV